MGVAFTRCSPAYARPLAMDMSFHRRRNALLAGTANTFDSLMTAVAARQAATLTARLAAKLPVAAPISEEEARIALFDGQTHNASDPFSGSFTATSDQMFTPDKPS